MDPNLAELKALHAARTIYVVVAERRDGTKILLQDPGMNRPWSTKNKRLADSHAAEVQRSGYRKAAAMTLEEAFTLLQKQFSDANKKKFKLN